MIIHIIKTGLFEKTSWEHCPWVIIKGNNKDIARLEALRFVLRQLDYPEKGNTGESLEADRNVLQIFGDQDF